MAKASRSHCVASFAGLCHSEQRLAEELRAHCGLLNSWCVTGPQWPQVEHLPCRLLATYLG